MKIFKKCPLCMGIIENGECRDCGYTVPEEEELDQMSGIYDFDPDDYPYDKTPSGDDIMPKAAYDRRMEQQQAAYAEPQPRNINIQVVDTQQQSGGNAYYTSGSTGNTVRGTFNQNTGNTANNTAGGQNSYGSFTPYTPAGNQTGGGKAFDFSNITADMWIQLAISLFVPVVGIFLGIKMLRTKRCREEKILGIICLIKGCLLL